MEIDKGIAKYIMSVYKKDFMGRYDARQNPIKFEALPGQSVEQTSLELALLSNLTSRKTEAKSYKKDNKVVVSPGDKSTEVQAKLLDK